MEQLIGLAKDGLFATLFVIAALVNVFQYRLNNSLRDQHLQDWKDVLSVTNTMNAANQKLVETTNTMVQGIDKSIQRLLDKNGLA